MSYLKNRLLENIWWVFRVKLPFSNSSGVWRENIWCVFRVKFPFRNFSGDFSLRISENCAEARLVFRRFLESGQGHPTPTLCSMLIYLSSGSYHFQKCTTTSSLWHDMFRSFSDRPHNPTGSISKHFVAAQGWILGLDYGQEIVKQDLTLNSYDLKDRCQNASSMANWPKLCK